MSALAVLRRLRIALVVAGAVTVVGAAPSCAIARDRLGELTLIRSDALSAALGDGRQWLAWGTAPGLFTIKQVQLNRPDRLSAPGCTPPGDLAFGRLLTACPPTTLNHRLSEFP